MAAPITDSGPGGGLVPERMLTVDDVAAVLACHPNTVRNRILSGTIRSVKIGRLRRVRQSDLSAYLRDLPDAGPTGADEEGAA